MKYYTNKQVLCFLALPPAAQGLRRSPWESRAFPGGSRPPGPQRDSTADVVGIAKHHGRRARLHGDAPWRRGV
jgi:hypothetical protein